MGLLEISVAAGEQGPVLMLSGEADLTTAVIRALVLANRTLKARGGGLELMHPQPVVARALSLLGVDQVIEVRDGTSASAEPDR